MRSSDNLEIKEKEERHEYYTDWVRGTAFVLIGIGLIQIWKQIWLDWYARADFCSSAAASQLPSTLTCDTSSDILKHFHFWCILGLPLPKILGGVISLHMGDKKKMCGIALVVVCVCEAICITLVVLELVFVTNMWFGDDVRKRPEDAAELFNQFEGKANFMASTYALLGVEGLLAFWSTIVLIRNYVEHREEGDLNITYDIKIVKHEIINGAVFYTMRVAKSNGETFHIKDRYRSMRNYYTLLHRAEPTIGLPIFPTKKWFGNTSAEFIGIRKGELSHFFSTVLKKKELASLQETRHYLTRTMDPASNKKMSGKREGTATNTKGKTDTQGENMGGGGGEEGLMGKVNSEGLWRKIVDDISKRFLDLTWAQKSFDYDNLVERSKVYKIEFKKQLNNTFSYVSSFMKLPEGSSQNQEEEGIGDKQKDIQMLMLLDDNLGEIADIIANKGSKMYPKLGFTKEFSSI